MPEKSITQHALTLFPWLAGIFVSIVGIFIRNEWTTRQMKKALFDEAGDLRLVKQYDCDQCRRNCKESFEKALTDQKELMERARQDTRYDIHRLHAKIDELPEKIISLLRSARKD
jgi:hypothetical protein